MHFVVVGAGRVGRSLAENLLERGNEVVLIDKSADAFRNIERHKNLTTLVGLGFEKSVLESANIQNAAALAAVTSGDNSNIVIARIAKENFGVQHVCARIYDPQRAQIYKRLGISTVASVTWTTEQFVKHLAPENEIANWVDPSGNIVIIERLLPSHWAGKKLEPLFDSPAFSPIAISHMNKISIPTPSTKAHDENRIYVACSKEKINELQQLLDEGSQE